MKRRLIYLALLSMVAVLVFASAALAQDSSSVQDPSDCPAGTRAMADGNGAMGSGEFIGCVPLGELCDASSLTASQYSECIATPEEITAGSGRGIPEYAPGASALPDTGGPSVLLAGGVLLLGTGLLGIALLRKRAS